MSYPFIEGYPGHMSGHQSLVNHLVMHGTVSQLVPGGARGNANYFTGADSGGLAHFVGDAGEVIQCCREDIVCWHAPPNPNSIGFEFVDPQGGPDRRWGDRDHTAELNLLAKAVSESAARWHVPIAYLTVPLLLEGARGITTHYNKSQAFHKSDHTDPGPGFPMAMFLGLVRGHARLHPAPPHVVSWWTHTIAVGSTGEEVTYAQEHLHVQADGIFGPGTAAALRAFQQAHHITADGVLGPQTAKAMGA